jgi:hypothetical protein
MYVNLTQKLVWIHTVKKNHAIHEEWIWIDNEKEVYNSFMYLQPMSLQNTPLPAAINCMQGWQE